MNKHFRKTFPHHPDKKLVVFFGVKQDNIDDDVVVVSATANLNAQNKKQAFQPNSYGTNAMMWSVYLNTVKNIPQTIQTFFHLNGIGEPHTA